MCCGSRLAPRVGRDPFSNLSNTDCYETNPAAAVLFLTATLVTLTSCHKDSTEEYFAPRSVTVEIAVRPDAMIGLTRSTDEMAIRDVNLYLYAKKGAMVLHRYFVSRQFSFECPPGDYMLYLIANAREDLGELDEAQLEDYAIHWQGSYEELPMTTCQELSITTGSGTTQSLSIEVTRQVAKVACNIAVASAVRDIHLESVQFCNLRSRPVPLVTALHRIERRIMPKDR